MWTLHRQQQQRGAQMHVRGPSAGSGPRQAGEAPAEASEGRAAQEHDRAGDQTLQPGDYPASPLAHGDHDDTPNAPTPQVEWNDVVQPERAEQRPAATRGGNDLPLPEGK